MKLFIVTLIWLLVIQFFVTLHFWIIEWKKRSPRHLVSWLILVMGATILSRFLYPDYTRGVISALYLGLLYWIVFPFQLNLFRKKDLLYIGEDSDPEEDSIIDKFERYLGNARLTLGLKIFLLLLSGYCLATI